MGTPVSGYTGAGGADVVVASPLVVGDAPASTGLSFDLPHAATNTSVSVTAAI